MGCTGSNATSQAGSPQMPAAPVLEGDFKILLEKTLENEGLGLVMSEPDWQFFFVVTLKEDGLIPAWNRRQENAPELQVRPGDSILAVNGVSGSSAHMRSEYEAQKSITLTVKRGVVQVEASEARPAGDSAVSEEPAAEPPSHQTEPATECNALFVIRAPAQSDNIASENYIIKLDDVEIAAPGEEDAICAAGCKGCSPFGV